MPLTAAATRMATPQELVPLLTEVALLAAYHSLLLGELPAMPRAEGDNLLAEMGLLGALLPFGGPDTNYGRWRPQWDASGSSGSAGDASSGSAGGAPQDAAAEGPGQVWEGEAGGAGEGEVEGAGVQRWLFTAQQARLSLAEMDTYQAHKDEYESMGEDFFGNFS